MSRSSSRRRSRRRLGADAGPSTKTTWVDGDILVVVNTDPTHRARRWFTFRFRTWGSATTSSTSSTICSPVRATPGAACATTCGSIPPSSRDIFSLVERLSIVMQLRLSARKDWLSFDESRFPFLTQSRRGPQSRGELHLENFILMNSSVSRSSLRLRVPLRLCVKKLPHADYNPRFTHISSVPALASPMDVSAALR